MYDMALCHYVRHVTMYGTMSLCPIWHYVRYGTTMSDMALCPIWHYVRYGTMSDMALLCPIWHYVRYGTMSDMGLCPIWHYVAISRITRYVHELIPPCDTRRKKTREPCTYIYTTTHKVCAPKKLPLPFNETERNGPFNETERAVHDPFFIRSRSVRIFRPF